MMEIWGATEQEWKKGPWTPEEDKLLIEYVMLHGEGRWSSVARSAGLNRSGKSCRLRWVNYLRPGLKRGQISPHEEAIIVELHSLWGNKWSTIARYLPGRTDNEIKNYWRTHFKKEKTSKKHEIRKARILRQKQSQMQENDMKTTLSNAETGHDKMNETETKQEVVFFYPSEEEDFCLPVIWEDFSTFLSDDASDNVLLDGLWNLDEGPQFHIDYMNIT